MDDAEATCLSMWRLLILAIISLLILVRKVVTFYPTHTTDTEHPVRHLTESDSTESVRAACYFVLTMKLGLLF